MRKIIFAQWQRQPALFSFSFRHLPILKDKRYNWFHEDPKGQTDHPLNDFYRCLGHRHHHSGPAFLSGKFRRECADADRAFFRFFAVLFFERAGPRRAFGQDRAPAGFAFEHFQHGHRLVCFCLSREDLGVLFLGRIIDGMAAGNFPIAQSYLSDISKDEKDRTANFGTIGAIFGIAFIVGPVLGSLLSSVSPAFPFWFAGGLAAANFIGAIFFLPETHNDRKKGEKINFNPFSPLGRALKEKILRSRYAAWFFFGLATSMLQAIFALYMGEQFGIKTSFIGFIFAGMGILMAFNQGVLLKRFWLKKFKESHLEIWLFPFFAGAFLLMGIHNVYLFIFGMIINVFTQSVLRVVISSRVAGIAGHFRRGEALGVMSSVLSAAMITGPLVAGLVFEAHPSLPFIFGALSLGAAFLVMKFSAEPEKVEAESDTIVPEAL